ncbi:MAG: polyphosphate polymerase domain-containing protein [Lachnospiraceae bacterium]|nr:polyphosphate polymerase domain-containing protein [Lachnospiraceae bacterium]
MISSKEDRQEDEIVANQYTFKRKEMKYLLSKEQYLAFMDRIKDMAKVDAYGETSILNIYFDTPDFQLIRTSLEKPVYKEKLRLRSYGVPTDETNSFIEIKKKYKGIVYKRRISAPYKSSKEYLYEDIPLEKQSQISAEIDYFKKCYPGLRPAMAISYDRIAMAGTCDPELRITFDKNIRWRTNHLDLKYGNEGREILEKDQYLMELKIAGAMDLKLVSILEELDIRQISFSKYGRGYETLLSEQLELAGHKQTVSPEEKEYAIA